MEEFSKDFQLKEPKKAINENYDSFINSIKKNREKSFGFFSLANILSIFLPGLYSLLLKYKTQEDFKKVSPYRDDAHYKENQKKIDEYDRSVAVKELLEPFIHLYSQGSSAEDFSKAFEKLDRKILSDAGYEGGSTFSEMGLKLYLYECISKMRISPQEAYDKMVEIPEDLLKRIVELLDEIEAGQDDFLRSIYKHTSTLQQYGIEDYANYEKGDRWNFATMLFMIKGSDKGKNAERIFKQKRSGFKSAYMMRIISTTLTIALFVCCMYLVSSDKYVVHMVSSAILLFQSITLLAAVLVGFKDIICLGGFGLATFSWLIYFCYSLLHEGKDVKFFKENDGGLSFIASASLAAVTLISLFVGLKKDVLLVNILFNLMSCDPDTLITEALVSKHNVKISRYINALLSLHYIFLDNRILIEIFLPEMVSFDTCCLIGPDDTDKGAAVRKEFVDTLNYLSGQCEDVSLLDVLSNDFSCVESNVSFTSILYSAVEILGMLAFNAAKIRVGINMFSNKALRDEISSVLK